MLTIQNIVLNAQERQVNGKMANDQRFGVEQE